MKIYAKIEVDKGNGHFFYTGELEQLPNGDYIIDTIKGERLIFRREQVVEIQEKKRSDMNDNIKTK